MNKLDLIFMALKNLSKRKVRTALTVLSVVIGATSIIVMVSLGVALDVKFDDEIKSISTITQIDLMGFNSKITRKDIDNIKKMKNVEAVSPNVFSTVNISIADKYVGVFNVVGVDSSSMELFNFQVEQGRLLDSSDSNKNSIVFGGKAIYAFSKKGKADSWYKYIDAPEDEKDIINIDVLNSKAKINTNPNFGVKKQKGDSPINNTNKSFPANIVGVLASKNDYYLDHYIYMPIERLEFLKKQTNQLNSNKPPNQPSSKKGYENVKVKVNDFKNVEDITAELKEYFAKDKRDITVQNAASFIQSAKRMTKMVQSLLGGIGGISLFIAAIGIANTMVMSIYERTKEIGIMKVIGAKVSDIKDLFLLEATLIGCIGGFLGVLFSYFTSFLLNNFISKYLSQFLDIDSAQKISVIPFWLSFGSLIFSSLIGLLAGYLPARKVVKIEALKAIKTD